MGKSAADKREKKGAKNRNEIISEKSIKESQTKEQQQMAERIVTMKALEELSDDDADDGNEGLPPESEWSKEALALKAAIDAGKFDTIIHRLNDCNKQDGDDEASSFQEVDLDSDSEDGEDEKEEEGEYDKVQRNVKSNGKVIDNDYSDNSELEDYRDEDVENNSDEDEETENSETEEKEAENYEDEEADNVKDSRIVDNDADNAALVDNSDDDETGEQDDDVSDDDKLRQGVIENNVTRLKALQVVTASLIAEKRGWSWSETFDIVPPTPLPFNNDITKKVTAGTATPLGIHDDLQRELAFYDVALEAALEAKVLCHKAGIPFTRPDDFFAEMVKTDDHMAKVKDRLIFEGKKIEAVAQRKSNKEQKLRAKETQANKLAEKAKRKREHMKEVSDWAESAKASRGGNVDTNIQGNNKKRAYFDQKYGHGGKRGRFKQNDPQSMNDMSSYNKKKGTFINTPKTKHGSKAGAGANRKGKRARDASRSKSR